MFDQQSSNVSADRGGIAAGRDVNIGVPPEVLIALIQQQQGYSETQKKLISELETKLDLTQGQIQVAFDILGEGKVPPERLGTKLVEIAEQFKVLSVRPGSS